MLKLMFFIFSLMFSVISNGAEIIWTQESSPNFDRYILTYGTKSLSVSTTVKKNRYNIITQPGQTYFVEIYSLDKYNNVLSVSERKYFTTPNKKQKNKKINKLQISVKNL